LAVVVVVKKLTHQVTQRRARHEETCGWVTNCAVPTLLRAHATVGIHPAWNGVRVVGGQ